jgi:hypothetical protein
MMKFINHLEGLLVSKYTIAKALLTLFKLEAKLAGLNIAPLLISIGAITALCFSGWLLLVMLIAYPIMLLLNPFVALFIIFALNVLALGFAVKSLMLCVKQMSFEKTRALLTQYQPKESHELTQRINEIH